MQKRATLSDKGITLIYDGVSWNEKVLGINTDESFIWNTHFA